jgi:hypothetical protein
MPHNEKGAGEDARPADPGATPRRHEDRNRPGSPRVTW